MRNDTNFYIKLIVSWLAVSQSVSVGPVSGLLNRLLNIPAWWWWSSWYHIFIFFLSFIPGLRLSADLHFLSFFRTWVEAESFSSWVLLKAFRILVLGSRTDFLTHMKQVVYVWYWRFGTNGLVISLAPYHALSYIISLVVSCLSLVSTTLVGSLLHTEGFVFPQVPIICSYKAGVVAASHQHSLGPWFAHVVTIHRHFSTCLLQII